VTMGAGLRPTAKAVEWPPDPTVRAPVFYPTGSPRWVTAWGHPANLMVSDTIRSEVRG